METYFQTHNLYADAVEKIERIARQSLDWEMQKIIEIIDDTLAQVDHIETEERRRLNAEYYAERECAA